MAFASFKREVVVIEYEVTILLSVSHRHLRPPALEDHWMPAAAAAAATTRRVRNSIRRPIKNRKQGLNIRGATSILKMKRRILMTMMAFEWMIYSHTRENVPIVVITMMAFASRRLIPPRGRTVRFLFLLLLLLLDHHRRQRPHALIQQAANPIRPRMIGRVHHTNESSVNLLLLPQQQVVEIPATIFGVPTLVVVTLT